MNKEIVLDECFLCDKVGLVMVFYWFDFHPDDAFNICSTCLNIAMNEVVKEENKS